MTKTSFRSASVVRFLALALVPIITLGIFAGLQIASLQREAISYRNSLMAQTVRADTEAFLRSPEIAAVQFVDHSDFPATHNSEAADTLTEHLPMLESVALADHGGKTVAASARRGSGVTKQSLLGLDRSRDPLFLAAKETTAPVWSGVFTSPASGRRVLGMAISGTQGVWMANVDIETLAETVKRENLGPMTAVVVTDESGTVLFHSKKEIANARPNVANLRPISEAIAGRTGSFRFDEDGEETLGSTALVGGTNWVVLVEQHWDDSNHPVIAAWSAIGLFMVVVALVAISAAIIFAEGLSQPVVEISEDALRLSRGDYRTRETVYHHRELERLADSMRITAAAVAQREADLAGSQVALEQTNARLEQALREQEQVTGRLMSMSAELSIAEERERRRLAEELHDRVSQSLAVARMRLGIAAASEPFDTENAATALRLLTDAIAESRAITNELAPPILYELGLGAALREMGDRIGASHGIRVDIDVNGDESGLSDEVRTLLLRSARELVINAGKHSGVGVVSVTFESDGREARLTVEDAGSGFDPETVDASQAIGFGLFSIEHRLLHVGGSCEIESVPGEGTRVFIRVPLTAPDEAVPSEHEAR